MAAEGFTQADAALEPEPGPAADSPPLPLNAAAATPLARRRLHQLTQHVLAATAVGCAAGVAVMLLLAGGAGIAEGVAQTWPVALGFGSVGLAAFLARRLPPARIALGLVGVKVALMLVIGFGALHMGWGLGAPGFMLYGLIVCVASTAAGWRAGTLLVTLAALLVLLVAATGLPVDPQATALQPMPPLGVRLSTLLINLASGYAAGVVISRLLAQGLEVAEEREQRFRRLLALSVDGYWEIDERYRLKAAADRTGEVVPLLRGRGLDAVPWELPQWQCDAETQDVMLADLESRQAFRDLTVRWNRSGGPLTLLVSGEPRFDSRGIFTGYWGVVRDVTAEHRAQAALEATETRYHELFTRIPTPLVLHRHGRILDANAAALALFGLPELTSRANTDLLAFYEAGDSRERERQRMELLHGQRLGVALPPVDFNLAVGDRRLAVRATSVRVDAEGGPAMLSIYVDETDRLSADEALRSSEGLLATLVASSPDLITLTEIDSGRYAMVNRTFERVTGWTAAEVIGRTAIELGIWGEPQAREAFVAQMRKAGSVSGWPHAFAAKDGTRYEMLVSAARFAMNGREYMVINARDVTDNERVRLEREAILHSASIGIAVTRKRRFVMVNRHFEQMFGWGPGELNGQSTLVVWGSATDRSESGAVASAALLRGEPVDMERQARRKDGSTFTASVRGRSVDPRAPVKSGLVWIVEDVTARRDFERAQARARDEAEAASRAKSAFLANTSHELRTPLNGLIGLSRLARDESLSPERRRQYLEQIELSSQSLAGIISDILDLSRIEAGRMPIERASFDLGAELQALHRTYAVLAELRGLRLHIDIGAGLSRAVTGDALRLRQILSNYLVNAIKFTEAGTVLLRARRLPETPGAVQDAGVAAPLSDRVRLEVQDTGRGIAAATLPRLFQPFTQADESTTRRYGGTGLGLSICSELAKLMGGGVGADSVEGQGSNFWVELPLPEAEAPARTPVVAGTTPQGLRQLPGARILMVEDNAVNMMIAVAMLERWGVAVTQAVDGREALAAIQRAAALGQPFHAVLMDVQMPVMSGHEATRALRRREAAQGVAPMPVIALTAAALMTEREEAMKAGMNDFLTKPVDAEKLFTTLLRWCGPTA